jgi:hypothetical protein
LLDPIYASIGVAAVITLADGTTHLPLTALDKTSGVEIGNNAAKVDTIEPAACIRNAEWRAAGQTAIGLEGASIQINGSLWDIVGYKKRPTPNGERDGELLLILSNETVIESESGSESSP